MLHTYKVSTIHDKYEITENIIADSFLIAAKIFAEYYHHNIRNIFYNDIFVKIDNKEGITKRFKLIAKKKVEYWEEII